MIRIVSGPGIPDHLDGIKLFLSRKKSKYHKKLKRNRSNSHPKILDDTSSRRQKSVAIQVQPQMRSRDPQTHIRTLNQSTQVYIPDAMTSTGRGHSGSIMTNRQAEEVTFAEPQRDQRGEQSMSTRRTASNSDYGEESEPPRHVRYTGLFAMFAPNIFSSNILETPRRRGRFSRSSSRSRCSSRNSAYASDAELAEELSECVRDLVKEVKELVHRSRDPSPVLTRNPPQNTGISQKFYFETISV